VVLIYRQRILALYGRLRSDDGRTEAAEVFRTSVDRMALAFAPTEMNRESYSETIQMRF